MNEKAKESPKYKSISELTDHIQSLKGKERQNFCRTLSMEEKKSYLKCLKEKEMEKVRGIYRCFVPLGGSIKFSCKLHSGDVETYEMVDGNEYEIPLGVAKHLRDDCWYPVHQHAVDSSGKALVTVGKKTHLHSFDPAGFFG